jgi:TonB family protein
MLGSIVLTILAAGATFHSGVVTEATATQQPPASAAKATAEKPWPPPGVVRPGAGVVSPRLIKGSRPNYTADAMHGKITGNVVLEAVVETDGTVGEVRVKWSLDREFGLDDEAVRSVKKWQFAPGKKDGIAVPVLVEVEMTFTLRK